MAEETGISYSHLSRIENDSTVPNADTVARIAEALDGDLKQMLEMADCLPRAILDRIAARGETSGAGSLYRGIEGGPSGPGRHHNADLPVKELALSAGIDESEVDDIVEAMDRLVRLAPSHRSAVSRLIHSLFEEGNEGTG